MSDQAETHKIKINNNSVYESAQRSFKSKRKFWMGRRVENMSREEMLSRLIIIKQQKGEISESIIKRDSVLVLYDVIREFGSIPGAKKAVKEEIRRRSNPHIVSKSEFKGQFETKTAPETESESEVEIPVSEAETPMPEVEEEEAVIIKRAAEGKKQHSISSRRYSPDEIYQILLDYARELGDVPSYAQIAERSKAEPDFPGTSTVARKVDFDWRARIREELGLTKVKKSAKGTKKPAKDRKLVKDKALAKTEKPIKDEEPIEIREEPVSAESPRTSTAFYHTDTLSVLNANLEQWLSAAVDIGSCSSDLNAFSTFRFENAEVQIDITLSARKP